MKPYILFLLILIVLVSALTTSSLRQNRGLITGLQATVDNLEYRLRFLEEQFVEAQP